MTLVCHSGEERRRTVFVSRKLEVTNCDLKFWNEEEDSLRSQTVTLKGRGRHTKYNSFAFTEQGVAMLSTVLKSERAIDVNIAVMRAFVKMRQLLSTHEELRRTIEEMEAKYDDQFRVVFEAISQLLKAEENPKPKIGFKE